MVTGAYYLLSSDLCFNVDLGFQTEEFLMNEIVRVYDGRNPPKIRGFEKQMVPPAHTQPGGPVYRPIEHRPEESASTKTDESEQPQRQDA